MFGCQSLPWWNLQSSNHWVETLNRIGYCFCCCQAVIWFYSCNLKDQMVWWFLSCLFILCAWLIIKNDLIHSNGISMPFAVLFLRWKLWNMHFIYLVFMVLYHTTFSSLKQVTWPEILVHQHIFIHIKFVIKNMLIFIKRHRSIHIYGHYIHTDPHINI